MNQIKETCIVKEAFTDYSSEVNKTVDHTKWRVQEWVAELDIFNSEWWLPKMLREEATM